MRIHRLNVEGRQERGNLRPKPMKDKKERHLPMLIPVGVDGHPVGGWGWGHSATAHASQLLASLWGGVIGGGHCVCKGPGIWLDRSYQAHICRKTQGDDCRARHQQQRPFWNIPIVNSMWKLFTSTTFFHSSYTTNVENFYISWCALKNKISEQF